MNARRTFAHAVAADYANRPSGTVHPRWAAQIDSLALPRVAGPNGWLLAWCRAMRVDPDVVKDLATMPVALLALLHPLPQIIAPPGSYAASVIDLTTPVDDPVLQRVRALLAQAESTTFDAEAETFTAKAHELMTRHAITDAMLDARRAQHHEPTTMRIIVDEPYLAQKMLLVHTVAANTRCRCVMHRDLALCSIVGLPGDVAATELLFTSLLVQAASALQQVTRGAPPGSRARARGFRASYWYGFARRVGERLAEVNEYVTAQADADSEGALLPVLAARSARVDIAVNAWFPSLQSSRMATGGDPVGWATGRATADRASLAGEALTG